MKSTFFVGEPENFLCRSVKNLEMVGHWLLIDIFHFISRFVKYYKHFIGYANFTWKHERNGLA